MVRRRWWIVNEAGRPCANEDRRFAGQAEGPKDAPDYVLVQDQRDHAQLHLRSGWSHRVAVLRWPALVGIGIDSDSPIHRRFAGHVVVARGRLVALRRLARHFHRVRIFAITSCVG